MSRLGSLKPTVFDLLEFTAGYHQTLLAKASSRTLTAFSAVGGLYQWIKALVKLVTDKPVEYDVVDGMMIRYQSLQKLIWLKKKPVYCLKITC